MRETGPLPAAGSRRQGGRVRVPLSGLYASPYSTGHWCPSYPIPDAESARLCLEPRPRVLGRNPRRQARGESRAFYWEDRILGDLGSLAINYFDLGLELAEEGEVLGLEDTFEE